MAKPANKLSEEQQEQLRANKYIRGVNETFVYYTDEFKRVYWQMYTEEKLMPHEILRRLGIDYRILGEKRVAGITQNLKKRHGQCGSPTGAGSPQQPVPLPKKTPVQELERLRAENEYLRQELEFVKKIMAAGGSKK